MKKLLILTSILTSIVFAGSKGKCELLYEEFVKRVPDQTVTTCKVKVEGRTSAFAIYFKMDKKQMIKYYSSKYKSMYTSYESQYVDTTNCIKDSTFTRYTTGSKLAEVLLLEKDCEKEYWLKHHPVRYYNEVLK
ncbi:hypothetical protein N7T98_25695 [Pseudomonas syringae pv. tomato]|uniref:hypothetical protein n=1 Tax=Pseudomonas syringae group genomosp. 3 TaxID=251701 RepID=UPI0022A72A46|nr:hypothetical protein [Pseudomonas syringae group genomosp. 3]MCZ0950775.1 hypothetical protein [Pseudomonas syringae pv. tomato]